MDKIFVAGLEIEAKHGYYNEERNRGNRFRFDIWVSADLTSAAEGDDLDRTIDYAAIADVVRKTAAGPSAKLVETLADRIVKGVFERFASAFSVKLRVAKLNPPGIDGAESAGVEVERSRA
jgi:dihydroneopterin aldolase